MNMNMAASTSHGGFERFKVDSSMLNMSTNEQMRKNVIVKEMSQLNVRLKNLEKEKISQLYNRRSQHREIFVQLEESDQRFAEIQKQDSLKLHNQLNKVKLMVLKFRKELDDIKATPEYVERLKVIMEEIENSISQFKEQQRLKYDELLHEEKTLMTEICALEKKFDSWTNTKVPEPGQATSRGALKSAMEVNKSLPPEVAAFDKFLQQTGGIRGGWDEYDHATFLKLKAKHKNHVAFVREAIHSLPTRSEQQITEHKSWHEEYLRLQEVKKVAIARWKVERDGEKDEKITKAERTREEEKRLEKQKAEQQIRQLEVDKLSNKERLQAWKDEQKKQREFEESRKRREEKKKAAEEEAWRRKQFELRVQVEEFKQKKAEENEFRAQQEEALRLAEEEERRRLVAERAGHIQERTKVMLDAKKAAVDAKERAEMEKQARLEKLRAQVKVEVSSDPDRLLKPTEGWKERQKQNEPTAAGRVYTMPHRAVPSWRQGMH